MDLKINKNRGCGVVIDNFFWIQYDIPREPLARPASGAYVENDHRFHANRQLHLVRQVTRRLFQMHYRQFLLSRQGADDCNCPARRVCREFVPFFDNIYLA